MCMRLALKLCPMVMLVLAAAGPLRAQAPNLPDNAVVNAASFTPNVAPGSIVAIFGTNFASSLQSASTVPLSTSMGGVSVKFNGIAAPLFFVSSTQINAQLPNGLTGSTATVAVQNTSGQSQTRTIPIAPLSPSIFALGTQAIVVFALQPTAFAAAPPLQIPGTSLQIPACPPARAGDLCAMPAKAGDFLIIYANGLGATDPGVPEGQGAPSAEPLARTKTQPSVTLGSAPCNVLFSGLVPGLVGLYQINVQVPSGVMTGNAVPLQISMGSVTSSNQITIAVQ
jgi:minor extracellular serine protease Vpr